MIYPGRLPQSHFHHIGLSINIEAVAVYRYRSAYKLLANETSLRLVIIMAVQIRERMRRVLLIINLPSSSLQDVVVVSCNPRAF
jgi:hypothetical protein